IDGVERERPPQHEAGIVTGPNVDELPRTRPGDELRRGEGLEPLAGKDLASVDELRAGETHRRRRKVGRSGARRARVSGAGGPVPGGGSEVIAGGGRRV